MKMVLLPLINAVTDPENLRFEMVTATRSKPAMPTQSQTPNLPPIASLGAIPGCAYDEMAETVEHSLLSSHGTDHINDPTKVPKVSPFFGFDWTTLPSLFMVVFDSSIPGSVKNDAFIEGGTACTA